MCTKALYADSCRKLKILLINSTFSIFFKKVVINLRERNTRHNFIFVRWTQQFNPEHSLTGCSPLDFQPEKQNPCCNVGLQNPNQLLLQSLRPSLVFLFFSNFLVYLHVGSIRVTQEDKHHSMINNGRKLACLLG